MCRLHSTVITTHLIPHYIKRDLGGGRRDHGAYHGLINFIDTKAKCRHLKNWPVRDFVAGVYLSEAPSPPPPMTPYSPPTYCMHVSGIRFQIKIGARKISFLCTFHLNIRLLQSGKAKGMPRPILLAPTQFFGGKYVALDIVLSCPGFGILGEYAKSIFLRTLLRHIVQQY